MHRMRKDITPGTKTDVSSLSEPTGNLRLMNSETFLDAEERSIPAAFPSLSSGETHAAIEAYYHYVNVLARVSAWRCFQIKLDPADLAHEAMLRVIDKWSQLRSSDPAAIKSWLRSVVMSVL
jgi:hypothetical protein